MEAILASAALPFLLFPVEVLFPFPFIVEEVAKLLIVVFVIKSTSKFDSGLKTIAASSIMLTLSESFFYFPNIYMVGNVATIFKRIALAGTMHTVTFLLLYVMIRKSKYLAPIALLMASIIHYLYNTNIPLK